MTTHIIRSATPSDLPQILTINTHYILNTVLTFKQTPPSPSILLSKYNDIKARRLPYLVAIDSSIKQKNENGNDSNDLVLGYAYLSPYRGEMLSYAPTVELTLFVHPSHQSRSVGSRLLAAILKASESVLHLGWGEGARCCYKKCIGCYGCWYGWTGGRGEVEEVVCWARVCGEGEVGEDWV